MSSRYIYNKICDILNALCLYSFINDIFFQTHTNNLHIIWIVNVDIFFNRFNIFPVIDKVRLIPFKKYPFPPLFLYESFLKIWIMCCFSNNRICLQCNVRKTILKLYSKLCYLRYHYFHAIVDVMMHVTMSFLPLTLSFMLVIPTVKFWKCYKLNNGM